MTEIAWSILAMVSLVPPRGGIVEVGAYCGVSPPLGFWKSKPGSCRWRPDPPRL